MAMGVGRRVSMVTVSRSGGGPTAPGGIRGDERVSCHEVKLQRGCGPFDVGVAILCLSLSMAFGRSSLWEGVSAGGHVYVRRGLGEGAGS